MLPGVLICGLEEEPGGCADVYATLNYALLPGVLICWLEEEPGGSADDSNALWTLRWCGG